jgi:hypothetical protein
MVGSRGTDSVAHLFEKHRIYQCASDFAQPVHRPGKVAVTVSLDRLLQRMGVHRKRICSDPFQCMRNVFDSSRCQLRESNIAEQQHVRCYVADGEAGGRLLPQCTIRLGRRRSHQSR